MHARIRVLTTLILTTLVVTGCRIGETTIEHITLPLLEVAEKRTCDSPFVEVDLSKLKACGEGRGKGHCFDESKQAMAKSALLPCEGGKEYCIPDKILQANGKKLKSCKFFMGGEGVCMSMVIPEIWDHRNQLPPDSTCDADERCTPCIDPRDGVTDTGVCNPAGAHEKECKGGEAGEAPELCCHFAGVCMLKSSVPEEQRDSVESDSCSDGKACIPITQVTAKPTVCDFLGTKGICMDKCFNGMLKGMSSIRGSCGPTEVCMPCAVAGDQGMVGCE